MQKENLMTILSFATVMVLRILLVLTKIKNYLESPSTDFPMPKNMRMVTKGETSPTPNHARESPLRNVFV